MLVFKALNLALLLSYSILGGDFNYYITMHDSKR